MPKEKVSIIITHWFPGAKPYPVFIGDKPDKSVLKAIVERFKEAVDNTH
jgi:hypothetical protein